MKNQVCQKERAFTLIETLVVISVIGLLASVALVGVNSARTKAINTKVSADLVQIQKQIDLARLNRNATLLQITGNGCSDCASRGTKVITNTANLTTLLNSWRQIGFSASPQDPWKTPYLLDENELEANSTDCRYDSVWSAGPDGINNGGIGDDIAINITHFICPN